MAIDFTLTDTQKEIQASAADFAKRFLAPVSEKIYQIEDPWEAFSSTRDAYTEMARAVDIAKCFCDDYKVIDLTRCFTQMMEWIETPAMIGNYFSSDFDMKVRLGNIKARLRMIQLYHVAHSLHGMVLSTDNYTEYLLGFWTLHGDVGDYGMIQHLWKSEVYSMAQCIDLIVEFDYTRVNAMNACVDAVPTDGLGITESDFDQFDVSSYQEVDRILYNYIYSKPEEWELVIPKVVQMYKATLHKRMNPISISRHAIMRREN